MKLESVKWFSKSAPSQFTHLRDKSDQESRPVCFRDEFMLGQVHISNLPYTFICTHIKQRDTASHTKPTFLLRFTQSNMGMSLDSTFRKINKPPGKGASRKSGRESVVRERKSRHRGGRKFGPGEIYDLRGVARQIRLIRNHFLTRK